MISNCIHLFCTMCIVFKSCNFFCVGFEEDLYKKTGELFAMSIIHGSATPRYLSRLMVAVILGENYEATLEDIFSPVLKKYIQQVMMHFLYTM